MEKLWSFTVILLTLHGFCCQNAPPVAHFEQLYGLDDHIPEDTPPGTAIYYVNASDPDSPQHSLSLTLDSNTFKFRSDVDYHIILFKTLNFEASTTASLVLTVSDGESDTIYNNDVAIDDVNDVQPQFSQLRYQQHVPELTPVGSLVLADVTVNDQDVTNDELEVTCTFNPAFPDACAIFYVNTSVSTNTLWRGNVYLHQPLDYETMQEAYQLHLTAKDGNPENNYLMNFEIIIDDQTDAPPYFTASFDERVKEVVPEGTYIVTIEALDGDEKDQRPIRYSFVTNPGSWFVINNVTGDISTARLLDRNSPLLGPQGTVTLNVTAQELLSNNQLGEDPTTQSFTDVTITIIDVNNNPPSFSQTHYSAYMPEDLENGQAIPNLTMEVQDADGMDNAYFKFVFSGLRDYEDVFRVSPPEAQGSATATIVVQNSSALDYDYGPREYILEVIAREVRTDANLSSTAIVTIYLEDANDNKPEFDVSAYVIPNLSELTRPGEFIAALPTATDIDTGLFGTSGIVYSLIGTGNNRFDLDRLTNYMKLRDCPVAGARGCLDYETTREYNLTLIATDNNGTGHETRLPLSITVIDENDNIPVFTSNAYEYRIQELTTLLRTDQIISATDRDSSRNGNDRIRYSLVADRLSIFSIDTVTAALTVNRPINFEDGDENGRLQIVVGAGNLLDGAGQVGFTQNVTVHIVIEDVNNNAPQFYKNYTASILENIRPGTQIVTVKAEDDDYGMNAAIEYNIVSGASNTFEIDIDTGAITRRSGAMLDYDVTPQYTIMVRATDKGNPRLSGYTYVVIDIIDNNNRDPYFNPPATHVNVSEDAAVGFVVVSMKAIDLDINAVLRYSLIEPIEAYDLYNHLVSLDNFNYTELFRIQSSTGQVFVNAKLDITVVKRIVYTVEAVDTAAQGPAQVGTGRLHIEILNANTHAPEFQSLGRENSVYEEQPAGSVVMVLTASDMDRDLVYYEITSQSLPGAFSVHPTTGLVTVASRIDYELVQVIHFTAVARDRDTDGVLPHSTSQQFSVNIININDHQPKFSQPYYEAEISENTASRQTVVSVLATDLDLPQYGDVRYRLPADVSEFRVDELSGAISKIPGVVFDREAIKCIQFSVIAYDGPGTPSRSTAVPVYVSIKDVNDNHPYFLESDIYITLPSMLPVGSDVTSLYAFDKDVDDVITYSISDDASDRYEVTSLGVVRTTAPLTHATDHVFDVIATDKAGHNAIVHVHITIVGNNNGPEWVFPSYNGDKITICENQQKGTIINPDKLVYAIGAVSYTFIKDGQEIYNLDGTFRLISDSGEIVTTDTLDREEKDNYLVQVLARSSDGLTTQRYLQIAICDENDNDPEFPVYPNGTMRDYHFQIESGVIDCVRDPLRNNLCGQVTAFDPDSPPNALIMYSITGGDEDDFAIDRDNGMIYSSKELDYLTVQPQHYVEVTAYNYRVENGQRVVSINRSNRRTAIVYIYVLPPTTGIPLIRNVVNLYTSIDTQIGACLDSMRPDKLAIDVEYTIRRERIYNGNTLATEEDGKDRFRIGSDDGVICTVRLFNPNYAGFHYQLLVDGMSSYGDSADGTANVWLTSNINKIRIVVDADTAYVNIYRQQILDALKTILGTDIVWIDSVGHYTTTDGSIDISKSNVIIYAVNETTRLLLERNVTTITYINKRIIEYKSIALSAKILRAEDITTTYIYLYGTGGASSQVTTVFPVGLLIAMLLLLPLLLLPFLLCCCLCCPCCAPLLAGGKQKRYVVVGSGHSSGSYHEETFIDDWYEQSKLYNNPAYMEDWDSGSVHMLVSLDKGGKAANGAAVGARTGEEITEEREEYYRENISGGGVAGGAGRQQREAAEGDVTDGQVTLRTYYKDMNGTASKAQTAVIVDSLTPAAAGEGEMVVMEEERKEQHLTEENEQHRSGRMQPLLTATEGDQIQMSSLSPATIDILDSASAYNAKIGSKGHLDQHKHGSFSHTATVPRYGNRYPPDSDDYVTSQSYESDYHSSHDQRLPSRTRYHEESGMTIELDAQPMDGMQVENVEYEVLASQPPKSRSASGYAVEHSYTAGRTGTLPRNGTMSRSGTIPRNGFTIELEPSTHAGTGMVAEREEYVLTDDEGLEPEFFTSAPRSPKQHKRYKKTTTTRAMRDRSDMETDDQY